MQSGSKFWRFSRSLTFNVVMIVVSLAVLAENVVSIQTSQAPAYDGVMILIWIVLAVHFIRAAYKGYEEKSKHRVQQD